MAGQGNPQAQQHQRNHQRVDMAAIGNLPQGKRMPEIGDHARHRAVHAPQQQHDQRDGDGLAAQQCKTHHGHVLTDPRDNEEEELRHRRIDGDGGIGPVDVGKDRPVAQKRQRLVGREIAIGIDAGGLNPAIPDIAIDVAGQQRIEQQHIGSQHDRNSKDEPQRAIGR